MDRLRKINRYVLRITWVFLVIGSIDHFVYEFLPPPIAEVNLTLLWVLVAAVFVGEAARYIAERRSAKDDAEGA